MEGLEGRENARLVGAPLLPLSTTSNVARLELVADQGADLRACYAQFHLQVIITGKLFFLSGDFF